MDTAPDSVRISSRAEYAALMINTTKLMLGLLLQEEKLSSPLSARDTVRFTITKEVLTRLQVTASTVLEAETTSQNGARRLDPAGREMA